MITFLSKLFIQNPENTKDTKVRQDYGVLCGAIGIFLNLLLFAGKFFAGLFSNSIAITADAFNNLSDAGSSIITLIGFKMAGQKPDPEHPFGHGRIEYISGLIVSFAILLMAFELIKSSADKILHPDTMNTRPIILVILLASILVKCYMFYYNRSIGKKIDSAAMLATATDSLSDCVATGVVFIATLIAQLTSLSLDGYFGLLVGLFILLAGINAAKETLSPLLGQAPDPEFVKQISDIVLSHDRVLGIHDLVVHDYGPGRIFFSLHAEVPANGDILDLHDMIDLIEHELQSKLQCSAVIHMDPVCVNDPEVNRLKQLVADYLTRIDASLTMHDFRTVVGPTHTNLIFDVVVPYRFSMTDEQLIREINKRIQADNPNYFAVIEIDKHYV